MGGGLEDTVKEIVVAIPSFTINGSSCILSGSRFIFGETETGMRGRRERGEGDGITESYCIAGNFLIVQNFVVFADSSAVAKIRTTKIFNITIQSYWHVSWYLASSPDPTLNY